MGNLTELYYEGRLQALPESIRMKVTDSEKHTSLLICEAKKSVKVPTPRVSISKHFSLSLTKGPNKLHRLSLASPSSLV